jgi:quercetin dioxygenase-like cupin family protein
MHELWFLTCCVGCAVLFSTLSAARAADNPTAGATTRPTTLPSAVLNWNEMDVKSTAVGGRRQLLQAATATLDQLEVHITTLKPGEQAHAPHRHPHEELIMLKDGTLEALLNDQRIPMPTGSVLFIAPNDLHMVKNVGSTPATYFVVTWRTPLTASAK